jgi:predicted PhzF superfamily epimerase YddE/YHI9
MLLPIYQVDAFTGKLFAGNPAAVIPMTHWLEAATMQDIAAENNLAETAFFVPKGSDFELRWFTPEVEVDLCGHATLASAHVLFSHWFYYKPTVTFHTRSGPLKVHTAGDSLTMDLPSIPVYPADVPPHLVDGLGRMPQGVWKGRDYLCLFDSEDEVRALKPDFRELAKVPTLGVIVTAKSKNVDFVSRFFAPAAGIAEDPVTGSAHSELVPFWSEKLGKKKLMARQISKRGGDIACELSFNRVHMTGKCITYLVGTINAR